MKRKDSFMLRNVGGADLLVPLGSQVVDMNGLVILNAAGRCLWEALAEDRSGDELATVLAERFEVDEGRARADVQVFLEEIGRLGLLEA
jgi:sensor domain CHASE-containing protein